MTFLVILGFVIFATFAVFGFIDTVYKYKQLNDQHQAVLKQIEEEQEKELRERLQYLAGIESKVETLKSDPEVKKDVLSELMQETAQQVDIDMMLQQEELAKKVSKQYTRR